MADFELVNPIKKYVVNGETATLTSVVLNALGVGTNQQIVAAVAGKRIRLMGYIVQSNTGVSGQLGLRDGNAGAYIVPNIYFPINTAPVEHLPVIDAGYTETSTGIGLFADVITAAVNALIHYIIYTP